MKNTNAKIIANFILILNGSKKVVYSIITNNDGTRGFRFNVLGLKGFARFRKGWKKASPVNAVNNSYRQFHFSFITIAFEKRSNPVKLSKTFAKART